MKVEKDTLIKDVVKIGPEAVKTLIGFGMGCIGCPASQAETIEEAAMVHGINVELLLNDLNKGEV